MTADLARYATLLGEVRARIAGAQVRAALAANRELLLLYWDIGRLIHERQAAEGWGAAVIPRLARDLVTELDDAQGFSERNLKRMVQYHRAYPQLGAVTAGPEGGGAATALGPQPVAPRAAAPPPQFGPQPVAPSPAVAATSGVIVALQGAGEGPRRGAPCRPDRRTRRRPRRCPWRTRGRGRAGSATARGRHARPGCAGQRPHDPRRRPWRCARGDVRDRTGESREEGSRNGGRRAPTSSPHAPRSLTGWDRRRRGHPRQDPSPASRARTKSRVEAAPDHRFEREKRRKKTCR